MNRISQFLLAFLCLAQFATAQDCNTAFTQNVTVDGEQRIETELIILISRIDYTYQIQFKKSEDGFVAKVISSDNKSLAKGNKLMFIPMDGEKRLFEFVGKEEQEKIDGRLCRINSLKLDMEGVEWLANNITERVRLVDVVAYKMYPYSLPLDRQEELKKVTRCFMRAVDLSLTKN